MPIFIATSPHPKCVTVDTPAGTFLDIVYKTPDVATNDKKRDRKGADTVISVHQPEDPDRDGGGPHKKKHQPHKKVNNKITNQSGKISHKVELDGPVQVCIFSHAAHAKNPVRLGFQIMEGLGDNEKDAENNEKEVKDHITRLYIHVTELTNVIGGVLREADYAKEREIEFHSLSQNMHAASQWWPIVHIFVLLLTGFTQASHMVRFFKSKRLV
eukprot:CAMPEP_0195518388 /NCGR_PEP_ID=MMETSP0794_2-20130614/12786_1 /TAXON_ID=515487 /ORGANISM="Stephanopyxis turris, Strain CCMP 815" /LENGTH=213 /DNA_ID=CAMNT_0040647339 /DNA_START=268 /DNA_END=909 /DNA_ORIENTATION=+